MLTVSLNTTNGSDHVKAVKIPAAQRSLLLAGAGHVTGWELWRARRLMRWCGQLPAGGVLTADGGMAAGCCMHYSFFRWRIWLHRHPGTRPVPADLRAALDGRGPMPEWFRKEAPATEHENPAAAEPPAGRQRPAKAGSHPITPPRA
jgi:hypothetical protein